MRNKHSSKLVNVGLTRGGGYRTSRGDGGPCHPVGDLLALLVLLAVHINIMLLLFYAQRCGSGAFLTWIRRFS